MHPCREAHYAFDPPRAQGVHPLSPGQLCIGPHDAPSTIFRRRASAVRLELRSRAGRTDCARGSHCRRQARRAEPPRAVLRANHVCRAGERVRERTSRQPRRRNDEPGPRRLESSPKDRSALSSSEARPCRPGRGLEGHWAHALHDPAAPVLRQNSLARLTPRARPSHFEARSGAGG